MAVRTCAVIISLIASASVLLKKPGSRADVYIGTKGKPVTMRLRLGRMAFHLSRNPTLWGAGHVGSSGYVPISAQKLSVIMAPVVMIVLCLMCAILALVVDGIPDPMNRLPVVLVFTLFAGLEAYLLVPFRKPNQRARDGFGYSKGYLYKKLTDVETLAREYHSKAKHPEQVAQATTEFSRAIFDALPDPGLYRHMAVALSSARDFVAARMVIAEWLARSKDEPDDWLIASSIDEELEDYDASLAKLDEAIRLDPTSYITWNNRGWVLGLMERWDESVDSLDESIRLNPINAYAYCNRGYAKLALGRSEEALADIMHAGKLDPLDAYVYRNLGLWHLDRGDPQAALPLFEKAKRMDPNTREVDLYIDRAKKQGASVHS
ncbi:MAG: tetratricopeptide repeat protein [bacterium]|nr:tetratricopeptide repeat protein [Candidatus Kapabacteria bacterium]